jgi:site-specific DNA-methyltransferase (adenine-specific)
MIYNIDCIDFMKDYESKVNLVLTSPPYNMTKRPGGDADSGKYDEYNDWKEHDEYLEWSADIFNNIDNILVENGVLLYNFSYSIENPSMPYQLVSYLVANTNFCIADTIIWKKKSSMPYPASPNRLQRICEFVFVFVRKNEVNSFTTNKEVSKTSKTGQKYYVPIPNFIDAKNNDGATKEMNQATFSTDLVKQLLSTYAKAEDDFMVFDPFMGTGTTAKGCIEYGCSYVGTEISKKQCEYANERLSV